MCTVAVLAVVSTAGFFAFTAMTPTVNTVTNADPGPVEELSPKNAIHPRDLPRQGMAFLVSYSLAIQPEKYHAIDNVKQPWLVEVIEKRETPIDERYLKEYFDITKDGVYDFGLTVNGITKYFQVEFYENPVTSPTFSYVKAYRLFDIDDQFEKIDLKSKPKLKKVFDEEFSWTEVDEETANELKQLMKGGKHNFDVAKDNGEVAKYDIRYFGPYFESAGGK